MATDDHPAADRSRREVLRLLGAAAAGVALPAASPLQAALAEPSSSTSTTSTTSTSSTTSTTSSTSTSAPPATTTTTPPPLPPGATIEHRVPPRADRPLTGTAPSPPASVVEHGETGLVPFSLVGFTVTDDRRGTADASFSVLADSGWTPWAALDFDHDDANSEPVWVGRATGYRVRVPVGATVTAHLGRDGGDPPGTATRRAPQVGPGTQPVIYLRSSWGARPPAKPIEYSATTRLGVVHHTVSSNAYGTADVPAILRSIQAYHLDVQGWDDIGYQFLVDRYGRLWEGRFGGIDRPTIGAQAKGFNVDAFGVAGIGDFSAGSAPSVLVSAIADLMAWRLGLVGIAADGRTTITSTGNEWFADGQVVDLPAIVGHRDTRPTECPGNNLYAAIPAIRAAARARQPAYGPAAASASAGPAVVGRDGRAEAYGLTAGGGVVVAYQQAPGASWSPWYPLAGGPSFPTTNRLHVIAAADGHHEAFVLGPSGQPHRSVQGPIGTGWSSFQGMGGTLLSPPAVARNADGRLEVFGIGTDHKLWHTWQQQPNGSWSGWWPLDGAALDGPPGVGSTSDGRLVVAAVGQDGRLHLAAQNRANGTWTAMVPIGGSGLAGRPAVGRHASGALEIVVRSSTGAVLHTTQAGFFWSSPAPRVPGLFVTDPALAAQPDGRLVLFGVGTDAMLYRLRQSSASSTAWDPWVQVGGSLAGAPSVVAYPDGRLEVFSVGTDGRLWHDVQAGPNGPWAGLTSLGGALVP
ncbi:MAG: N-acetylmuramoyl-L-alanine amidase [Acidimicrobiales bacterium]